MEHHDGMLGDEASGTPKDGTGSGRTGRVVGPGLEFNLELVRSVAVGPCSAERSLHQVHSFCQFGSYVSLLYMN